MSPITPGLPMSPLTPASILGSPPSYTSSHPLQQASLPGSPAQSLISNATLPTTPAGMSTQLTARQRAMQQAEAVRLQTEALRKETLRLAEEAKKAAKATKATKKGKN